MSELKCCPFCGGEAKICNGSNDIVGKQFLIRCKEINCTIRPKTDWHTSLEEAIKHWNTRKSMANIVEKLEEKTEFLKDCTKYGNESAEQQEKSYSTMMMYEVAGLVDDLIDIVKQEINKEN